MDKEELISKANRCGSVYDEVLTDELYEVHQNIQRCYNYVINNSITTNRILPSNVSERFCENLGLDVYDNLRASIVRSRSWEKETTQENIKNMVSREEFLTESDKNIDKFKEDGVHREDRNYRYEVEKIMEESRNKLAERIEGSGIHGEMAFDEIQKELENVKERIIELYGENSDKIVKTIHENIDEIGREISDIQKKADKDKDKDKESSSKEPTSMKDTLQGHMKSPEEVTKYDLAKTFKNDVPQNSKVRDNGAAFKDDIPQSNSSKKSKTYDELEATFL